MSDTEIDQEEHEEEEEEGSIEYPEDGEDERGDNEEYEYEGESGDPSAPPPPAPKLQREYSYQPMDTTRMEWVMRRMIERVAADTGLGESSSALLLRQYKWDEAVLRKKLEEDMEKAIESAGVQYGSPTFGGGTVAGGPLSGEQLTCMVCFESKPKAHCSALSCGHFFCDECWADFLANVVDTGVAGGGNALRTACMWSGCPVAVGEDMFKARLDPDRFGKYRFAAYTKTK